MPFIFKFASKRKHKSFSLEVKMNSTCARDNKTVETCIESTTIYWSVIALGGDENALNAFTL